MFDEDYIKAINAAYWEEDEELKLGTHPTQVMERIEKSLSDIDKSYINIKLDWNYQGDRCGVILDNEFYGIFNYTGNLFEGDPESRLNDTLVANNY